MEQKMLLGREVCRAWEVLGMKMSFLWAGKRLDHPEQLFPACGTGLWPPAAPIPCALTSRDGGSAHPHELAGSGPESCPPNPPAGQHVGMMFGVTDGAFPPVPAHAPCEAMTENPGCAEASEG